MLKKIILGVSCIFLFSLTNPTMATQDKEMVSARTTEEWPAFDKAQLKVLAQGRKAYQKNPVTGKGELFFVPKKLTVTEQNAYNKFKADIENVQAGDLQPGLEDKSGIFNTYNSPYGKIKIAVMPDIPGADADYEDTAGDYTAQDN